MTRKVSKRKEATPPAGGPPAGGPAAAARARRLGVSVPLTMESVRASQRGLRLADVTGRPRAKAGVDFGVRPTDWAGLGLKALKNLPANLLVTAYGGRLVHTTDGPSMTHSICMAGSNCVRDGQDISTALGALKPGPGFDSAAAQIYAGGVACMANSSRGTGQKPNCHFLHCQDGTVWLETVRAVPAGKELLARYQVVQPHPGTQLVGLVVHKTFENGRPYRGRVVGYDQRENWWRIRYPPDPGETHSAEEDWTLQELQAWTRAGAQRKRLEDWVQKHSK